MMNDYGIRPQELQKITGQSLKVLLEYERGDATLNAVRVAGKIARKKEGVIKTLRG